MNFWLGFITGFVVGPVCIFSILSLISINKAFHPRKRSPFLEDWGPSEEKS